MSTRAQSTHIKTLWPRIPAHAASIASGSARFSGWKKSRAPSWTAAQNGIGAASPTASQGDSGRFSGSRARKNTKPAGAVAARPAEEKISSTAGCGQSVSTAARNTKISSKWMPRKLARAKLL